MFPVSIFRAVGCALLLSGPAVADDGVEDPAEDATLDDSDTVHLTDRQAEAWAVRMARMEGAAVNVTEAATEFQSTATRIADSGRVHGLSDLVSDAVQLNRRVVSLTLATEVLVEEMAEEAGEDAGR